MSYCRKFTGRVMLLMIAAAPAGAAPEQPVVRELVAFKRIDSDRNGYVSRVEARSIVASERFDAADANKDGLLDHDEYATLRSLWQLDTGAVR